MHVAEAGALADRGHPPVGGSTVEALPVPSSEDRAFVTLADHEVDGACRSGHEGDRGRLVALPGDPQDPVATLGREVLDVGLARFAHPERSEEHTSELQSLMRN